ncbi:hypothetical protein [Streptomyces sp. NPDC002640]
MPDRSSPRLLTLPTRLAPGTRGLSSPGGERGGMLLRKPSEPGSPARDDRQDPGPREDDNPFAPPPPGQPSQEGRWSDRQPEGGGGGWSGWGQRPGGSGGGQGGSGQGPDGSGGGQGGPGGLRWDPTDPAQRRARYALLSGTWGLIFTLFGLPWLALLLGALALHWGISALRAPSRPQDPDRPVDRSPATGAGAAGAGRNPQRRAAIIGIVTGSIALLLVALLVLAQQVFLRDFYVCTDEALTRDARQACVEHLPEGIPDDLRDSLTVPN